MRINILMSNRDNNNRNKMVPMDIAPNVKAIGKGNPNIKGSNLYFFRVLKDAIKLKWL